jgi:hypothetical protein
LVLIADCKAALIMDYEEADEKFLEARRTVLAA